MSAPLPTHDEYELIKLMLYTSRLVETASVIPLRHIGLTAEEAAVLSGVASLDNHAMPIDIARRGARKPQTITANIKKLVARGLLEKEVDQRKKNAFRISLTAKGQAALEKASSIYVNKKVIASLTAEERANLQRYLEEIKNKVINLLKNTQHREVI